MSYTDFIEETDSVYGLYKSGEAVLLNLERMWFETKDEDELIILLCSTIQHELIHQQISTILDWSEDKEEDIVRLMTGEREPLARKKLWLVIPDDEC